MGLAATALSTDIKKQYLSEVLAKFHESTFWIEELPERVFLQDEVSMKDQNGLIEVFQKLGYVCSGEGHQLVIHPARNPANPFDAELKHFSVANLNLNQILAKLSTETEVHFGQCEDMLWLGDPLPEWTVPVSGEYHNASIRAILMDLMKQAGIKAVTIRFGQTNQKEYPPGTNKFTAPFEQGETRMALWRGMWVPRFHFQIYRASAPRP